jgi:hypothetical protein
LWSSSLSQWLPWQSLSSEKCGKEVPTFWINLPCSIFRVEGESAGSSEILTPIYQTKWCQIQEYNNLRFRHFLLGSFCTSNNWQKTRLMLYYLNCSIFGKYKCIIKLYTFVSISERLIQDCISHFILRKKTCCSDGE